MYVYNDEFLALKKGVKDGMYSAAPYVIARLTIEPFFMVLLSLCALGVPAYAITVILAAH